MTWTAIAWKAGPYVVIAILLGYTGWLKYEIAQQDVKEAKAVIAYKDKAEKLANELIIEQAIAMGITNKTAGDAKERISRVVLPPNELACESVCAASERQRIRTRSVRDIVQGNTPANP